MTNWNGINLASVSRIEIGEFKKGESAIRTNGYKAHKAANPGAPWRENNLAGFVAVAKSRGLSPDDCVVFAEAGIKTNLGTPKVETQKPEVPGATAKIAEFRRQLQQAISSKNTNNRNALMRVFAAGAEDLGLSKNRAFGCLMVFADLSAATVTKVLAEPTKPATPASEADPVLGI